MAESASAQSQIYRFDEFQLDLGAFTLKGAEGEISVEPQVMTLLGYFVQHPDVLVTKDELLDELWGHRFVSESAVSTQVKALRKALGDDGKNQRIVKTVHGKGFRFVAPVNSAIEVSQAPFSHSNTSGSFRPSTLRSSNLGYERTKLIGREDDLARCAQAMQDYRLVTLLGMGGTGKTRLAKAVGRSVQEKYPDGVWFVDLVPVSDGPGIDTAMASVMGVSVSGGESRTQIAQTIRDKNVLFILDSCEHIEDDVAAALDYYLEHTEAPGFLATSRDPIDLADELRFFIEPLSIETESGQSPAVELFKLTAQRHGLNEVEFSHDQIKQICSHLDGLPLAIELAAAQLKQLTIDELADRLDRRFEFLAGRQREGGQRQESLMAVVESTWQLLESEEQNLLGQLAVFPSQFTMTDIEEVFAEELGQGISFAMSRLVELCLLSRSSRPGAWWRLLETVRLFALEKLTPEVRHKNAQRHANWCLEKLGVYPEDHLHSFSQAKWSSDHYADVTAAELYFENVGDLDAAVEVCCAPSLMIQLDDGARASAKLLQIEHYLTLVDDPKSRGSLHGLASLCSQVTRDPHGMAEHAKASLDIVRPLGDQTRIAGSLILCSLNNSFVNPVLAAEQLAEAVQISETIGHMPTRELVGIYELWLAVVTDQYDEAVDMAEAILERKNNLADSLDNPGYNAVCALIATQLYLDPGKCALWCDRLLQHSDAHALWGATTLLSCALSRTGRQAQAAQFCTELETRLRRAGQSPWPDLLVALIVLADAEGETTLASSWLNAIRSSKRPHQTFHTIAVYRQLRDQLPESQTELSLEDAGRQALEWLQAR